MCVLSHVWLFATLWTAAHQAPLSMGFSRQEYWSGLPFPSPGDWSHVSCISCNDRWILYHCTTWKAYCRCCCSPNHSLNGKSLCNRQWGLGLGWWWERQRKMDSKDRLGENCYWRIDVKGRELILKDRCGRRGKGIRGTQGWVSGFGNWVMVVPFIDIGKTRARTGFFFFFCAGGRVLCLGGSKTQGQTTANTMPYLLSPKNVTRRHPGYEWSVFPAWVADNNLCFVGPIWQVLKA